MLFQALWLPSFSENQLFTADSIAPLGPEEPLGMMEHKPSQEVWLRWEHSAEGPGE